MIAGDDGPSQARETTIIADGDLILFLEFKDASPTRLSLKQPFQAIRNGLKVKLLVLWIDEAGGVNEIAILVGID